MTSRTVQSGADGASQNAVYEPFSSTYSGHAPPRGVNTHYTIAVCDLSELLTRGAPYRAGSVLQRISLLAYPEQHFDMPGLSQMHWYKKNFNHYRYADSWQCFARGPGGGGKRGEGKFSKACAGILDTDILRFLVL